MEEQGSNGLIPMDSGFSNMDVVGVELHEIYLALQRAGFDQKECLYIIGVVVSSGAMSPQKFDDMETNNNNDDGEDGDLNPLS